MSHHYHFAMAGRGPTIVSSIRLGVCAIYKYFSRSNRILLLSKVHARPDAANANR